MISHAIAISNGKGGSGKTSLTAHLAGIASAVGWQVLAIDLDPQGNLGQDLGYLQEGRSDDGAGLHAAVLTGADLWPVRDVRPRLDVIPAGSRTDELIEVLAARRARNREHIQDLEIALAPIAADYQLVVMDCPPGDRVMLDAALVAAHYVVIPTRADDGSLKGLERVAKRFIDLRQSDNPGLELLGVVLFDFGAADKRINADVRSELYGSLGDVAPVFDGLIRHARRAAKDMRRAGVLAHEYDLAAESADPWWKQRQTGIEQRFAGNAAELSSDYQRIVTEILDQFNQRQASVAEAGRA